MEYEVHPACAVIPLPPEQEIMELADSIRRSGLIEPITLSKDGLLLDGRCRLKACKIAGVEARTVIFNGDDPVIFVLDKNIHRRHLTNPQREIAVASLLNLQHGSNQYRHKMKKDYSIEQSISVVQAAKKYGLTKSSINRARTVIGKAAPNVLEMVSSGKVKPYLAEQAVQHASLETQADWTVEDVKREGRKVINNQPRHRGMPVKPPKQRTQAQAPSISFAKLDLGQLRRRGDQRVFLWPPHIQDLMDDKTTVVVAIGAAFTLHMECTPESFGAALKRLLAYKPVPCKTNGEEIDFAAAARKELQLVTDGKIRKAIDWLTGLESAIADAVQN